MAEVSVRKVKDTDREWIKQFVEDNWGAEFIYDAGRKKYPHKLDGFIAFENNKKVGLLTYEVINGSCEIVTIDSLDEKRGIGGFMLDALKDDALKNKWQRIWLITTNDNLNALQFYQKRGFCLVKIYPNAVSKTRDTVKPEIPLLGENGIPIRDEIELEIAI